MKMKHQVILIFSIFNVIAATSTSTSTPETDEQATFSDKMKSFQTSLETSMQDLTKQNAALQTILQDLSNQNSALQEELKSDTYPVSFDVGRTRTYSTTFSTYSRRGYIPYNYELSNKNADINMTTGIFTCTKAGTYMFTFTFTFLRSDYKELSVKFYKNYYAGWSDAVATAYDKDGSVNKGDKIMRFSTLSNSVIVYMNVNDTFGIKLVSGKLYDSPREKFTHFTGVRLSAWWPHSKNNIFYIRNFTQTIHKSMKCEQTKFGLNNVFFNLHAFY